VALFSKSNATLSRYSIDIQPEELYYSTMCLSPEGVVSALLGTKYEAHLVWWRFDRLGAPGNGLIK
jgi:hypothetical protein